MRNPTVVRGVSAAGPVLTFQNMRGTSLASVTGTSTTGEGSWQIQIQSDFHGGKVAVVLEHLRGGETRRHIVKASTAYTTLIPGLTVTFGATVNAEDVANVNYTSMFIVNT
jgi:hypothetical protein